MAQGLGWRLGRRVRGPLNGFEAPPFKAVDASVLALHIGEHNMAPAKLVTGYFDSIGVASSPFDLALRHFQTDSSSRGPLW
jgi:hypothetical protein